MALSPAEKQARYRRHRAGDHSRCDPSRGCREFAEPEPEPVELDPAPVTASPTFGPRGTELWAAMESVQMGPAHRVLLIQACRLADRLDRFDDVLSGGHWFFAKVSEENPDQAEIVIDNLLSEARQHAAAFKAIVTELEPKPKATAAPVAPKIPKGLASLTERIEKRKRSTGA